MLRRNAAVLCWNLVGTMPRSFWHPAVTLHPAATVLETWLKSCRSCFTTVWEPCWNITWQTLKDAGWNPTEPASNQAGTVFGTFAEPCWNIVGRFNLRCDSDIALPSLSAQENATKLDRTKASLQNTKKAARSLSQITFCCFLRNHRFTADACCGAIVQCRITCWPSYIKG